MRGKVLDVPALVDYATGRTIYVRALVRAATEQIIPIAVPAAALTVAWAQCDALARTRLAVLCETSSVVVITLGEVDAGRVGEVLEHAAHAGVLDVAAGQVAQVASERDWPVLTDRGPQLRSLAELDIEPLP